MDRMLEILATTAAIVAFVTAIAAAVSPVIVSYLWAAGVVPWWWMLVTIPASITGVVMIAVVFMLSDFNIF